MNKSKLKQVFCKHDYKIVERFYGDQRNYHSFNWNYENETLSLNKDLIIPYQDMKTDEYRHLIKKKVG